MFIIKKDKNLIKVLVLFLYSIFYINILEIPISIFYHSWLTPNGHLELVPAFLYSFQFTLYKTDSYPCLSLLLLVDPFSDRHLSETDT